MTASPKVQSLYRLGAVYATTGFQSLFCHHNHWLEPFTFQGWRYRLYHTFFSQSFL
jgi:hypothetical protein